VSAASSGSGIVARGGSIPSQPSADIRTAPTTHPEIHTYPTREGPRTDGLFKEISGDPMWEVDIYLRGALSGEARNDHLSMKPKGRREIHIYVHIPASVGTA